MLPRTLVIFGALRRASADGRDGNPMCWNGLYSFERCCQGTDASCWEGPHSEAFCCKAQDVQATATSCWVGGLTCRCCATGEACFDEVYTFDSCCDECYTKAEPCFLWNGALSLERLSSCSRRQILAACLSHIRGLMGKISGAVGLEAVSLVALSGILRLTQSIDQQQFKPPWNQNAALLRILATLGAVTLHYVYIKAALPEASARTLLHKAVESASIVLQDLYFLVSAYLVAIRRPLGKRMQQQAQGATIYGVIVDVSSALVGRIIRTYPAVIFAHFLFYCTGEKAPWLGAWPMGSEFICVACMHGFGIMAFCLGDAASIAGAIALLCTCMERRFRLGRIERRLWHYSYQSIMVHRLPSCIAMFILVKLVQLINKKEVGRAAKGAIIYNITVVFVFLTCWIVTAIVEWCHSYGLDPSGFPILLPWWLYPFPAKLFMVVGSFCFLEYASLERLSEVWQGAVRFLEVHSFGVLLVHRMVMHVEQMTLRTRNLRSTEPILQKLFHLPSLIVWALIAAALLRWLVEPWQTALKLIHSKVMICAQQNKSTAKSRLAVVVLTISAMALSIETIRSTCVDSQGCFF